MGRQPADWEAEGVHQVVRVVRVVRGVRGVQVDLAVRAVVPTPKNVRRIAKPITATPRVVRLEVGVEGVLGHRKVLVTNLNNPNNKE